MRTMRMLVGITVRGDEGMTDAQVKEAVLNALMIDPDTTVVGMVDGKPAVEIAAIALELETTSREGSDPRR